MKLGLEDKFRERRLEMLKNDLLGHKLVDIGLSFDDKSTKISFASPVIPQPFHMGCRLEFEFDIGHSSVGLLVDDEEIFRNVKVELLPSKNSGLRETSLKSALRIIKLLHK